MGTIRALLVSPDTSMQFELEALLREHYCSPLHRLASWAEAFEKLTRSECSILFADTRSGTASPEFRRMVQAIAAGGYTRLRTVALIDGKYPLDLVDLVHSDRARTIHIPFDRIEFSRTMTEVLRSKSSPAFPKSLRGETRGLTTFTPDLFSVFEDLQLAASRDVPVLLTGETGTGKTHTARLIHELSGRCKERFFPIACGVLPPNLIESELFGHVRGAFTGADRDRVGKFEAANNGTLLLDEIDVLTLAQQAKLLRIIESGEFEAIGSNEPRKTTTRLIVASNVDLKKLVAENRFRADLYYRLKVVEFNIPSLRNRPRDIVPIALQFIESCCRRYQIQLTHIQPSFIRFLEEYSWPGNVRELENVIHRAVLFCRNGELSLRDLPRDLQGELPGPCVRTRNGSLNARLMVTEQAIIEQALRAHGNNRQETARSLGITRVGLYKKMKKLGLLQRHTIFEHQSAAGNEPPAA